MAPRLVSRLTLIDKEKEPWHHRSVKVKADNTLLSLEFGNPLFNILSHLFPSRLSANEMRPSGKFFEVTDALGIFVSSAVLQVQRRGDDVVLFSGDEEKRCMRLLEINDTVSARTASWYVSALRHDKKIVLLLRLLKRHRVAECVLEPFNRGQARAVALQRIDGREVRLEKTPFHTEHTLWWSGVDADAGEAAILGNEFLHDQTTHRMSNEQRRLGKGINHRPEAVNNLCKGKVAEVWVYVRSEVGWITVVKRVCGRMTGVSSIGEVSYPSVPTLGILEETMNENNCFQLHHIVRYSYVPRMIRPMKAGTVCSRADLQSRRADRKSTIPAIEIDTNP